MLINLLTKRVADLSQCESFCLLASIQPVIIHTGFAEIFHNFSKVFFPIMIFRCHA